MMVTAIILISLIFLIRVMIFYGIVVIEVTYEEAKPITIKWMMLVAVLLCILLTQLIYL